MPAAERSKKANALPREKRAHPTRRRHGALLARQPHGRCRAHQAQSGHDGLLPDSSEASPDAVSDPSSIASHRRTGPSCSPSATAYRFDLILPGENETPFFFD